MDCAVCGKELSGQTQANIHPGCVIHRASSKGNTLGKVVSDINLAISKEVYPLGNKGNNSMSTLTVKCNYARDRVVTFGNVVLRFNEKGIAVVPAHYREQIVAEMRVKPGRYQIIEPVVSPPKQQMEVAVEGTAVPVASAEEVIAEISSLPTIAVPVEPKKVIPAKKLSKSKSKAEDLVKDKENE